MKAKAGFTLIEMTLAVAILAIISVTVYRFTEVAIHAAGESMQVSEEEESCAGLRRLLSAQLAALPANQSGTLIGVQTNRKGGRHDALQIVCPAGNAVLTPDATGFYQITLDLREIPRGSDHWALGMERTPWADDDDDDDDDGLKPTSPLLAPKGKEKLPTDWVKLMDGVTSFELAFFDYRLNDWVPKWTDANSLPKLVRMRVSVVGNTMPYEFVERVPAGGLAKVIPTSIFAGGFNSPTGQTTFGNGQGQIPPPTAPNGSNPTAGRPVFTGQNGAR